METFIVTVAAKIDHQQDVAQFYQELEPLLKNAEGFIDRSIYQANTGAMAEASTRFYSAEEIARHPEPTLEQTGVQFVIIEQWQTMDDRMRFSKAMGSERMMKLFPHLLPSNSHEFYQQL